MSTATRQARAGLTRRLMREHDDRNAAPVLRLLPTNLDPRTAQILLDATCHTQTETGLMHGIDQSRVSQIIAENRHHFDALKAARDSVIAGLAGDAAASVVVMIRRAVPSLTCETAADAQRFAAIAEKLLGIQRRLEENDGASTPHRAAMAGDALQAAKLLQTIADKPPSQSCVTSHLPAKGPDNPAERGQSAINPTSAKGSEGHVA